MKIFFTFFLSITIIVSLAQTSGTCTYIATSSTINNITSGSGGTYTVTYTAGNDSTISNVNWPSTIVFTFTLGPIVPTDAVSGASFGYNNSTGADNNSSGQNDFGLGGNTLAGLVPIQDYVNIQFSGTLLKNINFTNTAINQTDFDNDFGNNTPSIVNPSITGTYPGILTTPAYNIPTGINSSGLIPTSSLFVNSGEYGVYGPASMPSLSPNFSYASSTPFGWNQYNVGSGEANNGSSPYYITYFGKNPSFDRVGNSFMSNGSINNPYPWFNLLGIGDQSLAELAYGSYTNGTYSDNAVTNSVVYAPFVLNYSLSTLDVSYLSFTCNSIGNTAQLNWVVAQESNNKGFDIERSTDLGKTWTSIGFQASKAKGGNSDISTAYSYNDANPISGLNEYRLKQINLDGTYSYSIIESVNFDLGNDIRIFPNPAKETLTIENNLLTVPEMSYSIFDANGKLVQNGHQYFIFGGATTLNISMLSKGYHVLQLVDGSGKKVNLPFMKL